MVVESIRNNVSALGIISQLYNTQDRVNINLQRISSGLRINSPKDDVGGFVISNRLRSEYRGLSKASENTQNILNLTTTGVGALNEVLNLLNDIRDAAVAASGGSAAQQTVIQEKLQELNTIANTTKYGGKYLLNGSLTNSVDFKQGTRDFGASISFGPNSSTLYAGRSFLKIGQTNSGSAQITNGGDATFNTGITAATDIAVSVGQFVRGGTAALTTDTLTALTANRVSLQSNGTITFSGVIADGTTFFSGALSITGASTVQDLINSLQSSIDQAEATIGVDGTGVLETTVGLTSNGRLQFTSGSDKEISQFDATFSIKNGSGSVQTGFTVDRSSNIYNPLVGATTSGAKIGNNFTSVTGSTFDTGNFNITVSNIIAAQQRQLTTADTFTQDIGGSTAVVSGTALHGSFLNGVSIAVNDTFQINGTDPDGSTFTVEYTVGTDTGIGDGIIQDYASLIAELNNRDRSQTSYGFNGALSSLTGSGAIQLIDDVADETSTNLQIVVTDVSAASSQVVSSTINQTGSRETATFSIDGGTAQQANAGDVITLQGVNGSGGPKPEVTFRVGSGLSAGTDQLQTTAKEFVGQLNGGTAVTFQNGDQAVRFEAGSFSIYPVDKYQQVTLDFDSILDVTTPYSSGGETFILSTSSSELKFQVGSDRGQLKTFLFADVRSNNLGSSSSSNLDSINVTTATGATNAISIIDDAIDQVTNFSARLGAFESVLDDHINVLSAGVTNIESAYSKIVSADIAKETTELTLNSVLLQAQAAVLIQSNNLPTNFYEILYGLK